MCHSQIREYGREETNPQKRVEHWKCSAWFPGELRIAFPVQVRNAGSSPIFNGQAGDWRSALWHLPMFPLFFKFPWRHALSVPKRKGQIAVATLSSAFQELSQHREIVAKDIWKYCLEGGCVGNPGFKVLAELGLLHKYNPRSFRPPARHNLCKGTPPPRTR